MTSYHPIFIRWICTCFEL